MRLQTLSLTWIANFQSGRRRVSMNWYYLFVFVKVHPFEICDKMDYGACIVFSPHYLNQNIPPLPLSQVSRALILR